MLSPRGGSHGGVPQVSESQDIPMPLFSDRCLSALLPTRRFWGERALHQQQGRNSVQCSLQFRFVPRKIYKALLNSVQV